MLNERMDGWMSQSINILIITTALKVIAFILQMNSPDMQRPVLPTSNVDSQSDSLNNYLSVCNSVAMEIPGLSLNIVCVHTKISAFP